MYVVVSQKTYIFIFYLHNMFKKQASSNHFKIPQISSSGAEIMTGSGSSGSGSYIRSKSSYSYNSTDCASAITSASPSNSVIATTSLGPCYYNYFVLPPIDIQYDENGNYVPLDLKFQFNEPVLSSGSYISSSIYSQLCEMKHHIEKYQETWDNIKKFTNPFEFIHTNISGNKTNISKLRPLSRSFYKMIEIVTGANILEEYKDTLSLSPEYESGIRSFHLAEGPGGFIEAISYLRGLEYEKLRKTTTTNTRSGANGNGSEQQPQHPVQQIQILKKNTEFHDEFMKQQDHLKISRKIFERMSSQSPESLSSPITGHSIYGNDRYYGITLVNDDPICPGWRKTKTFLEANPNVIIETGADNTGNLISLQNYEHCISKYKNKMDIITADGGFDFSVDFNNQENIAIPLILSEVFYALALQKKGGTFILKIFDIFHKPTIDILYLLSYYYSSVSVMKPYTSRIANSEKYVICQGFKLDDSGLLIRQICELFPSLTSMNDNKSESITPRDDGEAAAAAGDTDTDTDTDSDSDTDTKTNQSVFVTSLMNRNHDMYFLNKIEEMNAILSYQQIENIANTLSIITTHKNAEKLEQYKKQNIQKCIAWCERYNIPHFKHNNAQSHQGNIFLHRA